MKNNLKRPLCATAAVSAVLALSSTPAFAQDATVAAPPAVQTVAPAATIAPPPVNTASPVVMNPQLGTPIGSPSAATNPRLESRPVVQAVPTTPEAQVTAATPPAPQQNAASESPAAQTTRTTEPRSAAAAQAPAAAQPEEPSALAGPVAAEPADIAAPLAAPASPVPASVEESVTPQPVGTLDSGTGLPPESIVGLLALLGAGGTAFAWWALRRRKSAFERSRPEVIVPYSPPVSQSVADQQRPAAQSAPLPAATSIADDHTALPLSLAPQTAGKLPTGSARQALLERMVAAAPDEANPFVSPKARRKRARIILQARDYREREADAGGFDWRTHRSSVTQRVTPVQQPVTV